MELDMTHHQKSTPKLHLYDSLATHCSVAMPQHVPLSLPIPIPLNIEGGQKESQRGTTQKNCLHYYYY